MQCVAVCVYSKLRASRNVTQTPNTQQTGDYDLPTKAPRRDESVKVLPPNILLCIRWYGEYTVDW